MPSVVGNVANAGSSDAWMTATPWQPDVATAVAEARMIGLLRELPDVVDIVTTDDLDVSESFGRLMPVSDLELLTLLGTTKPTRAEIEAAAVDIVQLRPFDIYSYLVAHDECGRPTDYVFCGAQVARPLRLCV